MGIANNRRKGRRGRRAAYVPKALKRKAPVGSRSNPDKGLELSSAMRALVVKENMKGKETKSVITHYPIAPVGAAIKGVLATQPAASPGGVNIWLLCPQVSQGDGETQRIGLTCQPVSLRCHGFIYMPPDAATGAADSANTSSMNFRLYILSSKKVNNYQSLTATGADPVLPANSGFSNMANRLLAQNGTVGPYTGQLDNDQTWKVNHKEVTVHHKRNYSLKRLLLLANVSGFQKPIKIPFSFNIPLPQKLLFNGDAKASAQRCAPMLVCGWAYDNGNVASVDANMAPKIIVTSELKFKDA